MNRLMITRFNNLTALERDRWCENNNYEGCIINVPVHIKEDVGLSDNIYVIEMNNDKNEIIGIGKIKNHVYTNKNYKIYIDNNYNRYTYRGKKKLMRDVIKEYIEIEELEKDLFKGKGHLKRGQGITNVTKKINDKYFKDIIDIFTNEFYKI